MPNLVCKRIVYCSDFDEDSFFEWIEKIECINSFKGVGDEIHLIIENKNISDKCLRELLAIFNRYNINLSQLAQFKNKKNKEWFYERKEAYWYSGVFGE